jgi:hypothetical protein
LNFDRWYFDHPRGVLRGYQRNRQGYLNPRGKSLSWDAFLRRFFRARRLRPDPAWWFLDVGAAKGFLVEALLRAGFPRVRGIDGSAYAIAQAPSAVRRHLRRMDVRDLGRGRAYDVVFCLGSLQYLEERELRRLLPRLLQRTARYLHIETAESPTELPAGDPSRVVRPYRWWKQALGAAAASIDLPVEVRRERLGNFYGPAIGVWPRR